ncbi:MAG: hypothetical protein AAGK17_06775 [Pseudomonadota bacterium]
MLAAFMLRTLLGAPCCADTALAAMQDVDAAHAEMVTDHSMHANHSSHANHHAGHDPDSTANPCCSACGPTLPPDPALIALHKTTPALPQPAPVRALATRPPFPAYDATGPPLLI